MKKTILSLLAFLIIFTLANPTLSAKGTTSFLKSDGITLGSIPSPTYINGVLFLPLVEIFSTLGHNAYYEQTSEGLTAYVEYADAIFETTVAKKTSNVYDPTRESLYNTLTLSNKPITLSDSSIGVPIDYITDQIGLVLSWNETYNTVVINTKASKKDYLSDESNSHAVYLKINNTQMIVSNYIGNLDMFIDDSKKTAPIVQNGTTLLPIATLIKELGGRTSWNQSEKKTTVELNGHKIDFWINQTKATVDGTSKNLSTPAQTINGRTMIPLRFVSENLGLTVTWDQTNQIIILYRPWFKAEIESSNRYQEWFSKENEIVTTKTDSTTTKNNTTSSNNNTPVPSKTGPYDTASKLVRVGDIVSNGFFVGEVLQVSGSKVLVNWTSKTIFVPKGDEDFWAFVSGVTYPGKSWIEASEVTITSSSY